MRAGRRGREGVRGEKKWQTEKNSEARQLFLSPILLTLLVCLLLPIPPSSHRARWAVFIICLAFVISADELSCNVINSKADVRNVSRFFCLITAQKMPKHTCRRVRKKKEVSRTACLPHIHKFSYVM